MKAAISSLWHYDMIVLSSDPRASLYTVSPARRFIQEQFSPLGPS